MKKAKMRAHHRMYNSSIQKAKSAEMEGSFPEAVDIAMSSWKHIDGMMRYERRYKKKAFEGLEGIDFVLKYAPFLFHFQSLDDLEALLKSKKRIDKYTSQDLNGKLEAARETMWDAHRLWTQIEESGELEQDQLWRLLGGDQDFWRSMVGFWYEMGLIRRRSEDNSYRISLTTRMDETTTGKCPSCGVLARAPKSAFFVDQTCSKCKTSGSFVILSGEAVSEGEE